MVPMVDIICPEGTETSANMKGISTVPGAPDLQRIPQSLLPSSLNVATALQQSEPVSSLLRAAGPDRGACSIFCPTHVVGHMQE